VLLGDEHGLAYWVVLLPSGPDLTMRFSRRVLRFPTRHALAVVALLAQFVTVFGAPVLSPRANAKSGSVPFPCQNHPCGCSTSEEGWAGDCCCFTLEQKLAWAEERGIEPPPHVRATVEARRAASKKVKSCCSKHTKSDCCRTATEEIQKPPIDEPPANQSHSVRWVAGLFAQKCHGEGTAGLLKFEFASTPDLSGPPRATRHVSEFARPTDWRANSTPSYPPTPPPRVS
jgi:hypothetical protein